MMTAPRPPAPLMALTAIALGVSSCCGAAPTEIAEPGPAAAAPDPAEPTFREAASDGSPKLVVALVIDQLGSWVLERYLPHLDPDGFFRTATARGRWYRRVVYPYASTFTAPGHAAIFTGKAPVDSGIVTNTTFDPATMQKAAAVYDPAYPVLAYPKHRASPKNLRVPTVGDALKAQRPGSKVYALSLKDRAAILPGGEKADLALWYEYKAPAFTTSSYYAKALPTWLETWLEAHPLANLMRPWEPADPRLLERLTGPDDGPGEGDYLGLGSVFPHDPVAAHKPWSVLRIFPQLSEYTVSLARTIAQGAELGEDEDVDLLCLSISGLDYTGHTFGPDSWEYVDHMRRLDAALVELSDWLEQTRAPVRFLVTADHGITPNPLRNPEGGGRLYPKEVTELAKAAAAKATGDAELVDRYVRPFVYFAPALTPDARQQVVAAVEAELTAHPGIRLAVDVRTAATWLEDPDRLRRAVAMSIAPDGPGDVYVVPEEHWVVDEGRPEGAGTTHGTPWKGDREVPVIVFGAGIEPAVVDEELSLLRVAPTLSKLLGAPPPAGVTEAPLPGIP
ncbi:MAG TPA: hypothetical protein ENK57_06185 [Polyangiaceae bacterium]|nr:hypothetical protein [Polyangiaceae bacterium]